MPDTQSTSRLRWLLWGLVLWAAIVMVRLGWFQVYRHDKLETLAQKAQQRITEIAAPRGTIFDRTGKPLAISVPVETVAVNPLKIPVPDTAAAMLAPLLGLKQAELAKEIAHAKARGSGFLRVKRKVSLKQTASMRGMNLAWVSFEKDSLRSYPYGQLAAHVLGSVGFTDNSDVEKGTAGIEQSLESMLGGKPGRQIIYIDSKGVPYKNEILQAPVPGTDVTLSIDPTMQHDAEVALEAAVHKSGARSGSVVLIDPKTGEILVMANFPTYDPNLPLRKNESAEARYNRAISVPFEPGSVFKVITLSAGLETTNLRPETMINCGNGTIRVGARVIHDHNSYSALSMANVLAKSSNIGAIQIGLQVGREKMYEYVRRYGFGAKTGIELPAESAGKVWPLRLWSLSSLGSISMGHEVTTTSVQLAVAGAVVANGGLRLKPRLVLSTGLSTGRAGTTNTKNGEQPKRAAVQTGERVLAPETAISMRNMMEGVVFKGGTGTQAAVRGYTVGGKTGSAQIYDDKLKAYTHTYNASFLGFTPVNDPQFVIAVTIVGTVNGNAGFGGVVAAPVFRQVAASALRIRDVPKDPKLDVPGNDAVKIYNDLPMAELSHGPAPENEAKPENDAKDEQLSAKATEISQPSATLTPFMSAGPPNGTGVVPDLRGLPLRGVLEATGAAGLPVDVLGDELGFARLQDPQPGIRLRAGRLRVQLAR